MPGELPGTESVGHGTFGRQKVEIGKADDLGVGVAFLSGRWRDEDQRENSGSEQRSHLVLQ